MGNDFDETFLSIDGESAATFEKIFMKKLAEEIEKDLQIQVHGTFIEGLEGAKYSETNLKSYLNIQPFRFFDIVFDVKRYIEEYMNKKFYQLTTNNLNDNQTYQKMRVLARNKYDLNLHEVYLPSQNLETGKDILEVFRNLASFAKGYTHNLHSQQFVEIVKDLFGIGCCRALDVFRLSDSLNVLRAHACGGHHFIVHKAIFLKVVVCGIDHIGHCRFQARKEAAAKCDDRKYGEKSSH